MSGSDSEDEPTYRSLSAHNPLDVFATTMAPPPSRQPSGNSAADHAASDRGLLGQTSSSIKTTAHRIPPVAVSHTEDGESASTLSRQLMQASMDATGHSTSSCSVSPPISPPKLGPIALSDRMTAQFLSDVGAFVASHASPRAEATSRPSEAGTEEGSLDELVDRLADEWARIKLGNTELRSSCTSFAQNSQSISNMNRQMAQMVADLDGANGAASPMMATAVQSVPMVSHTSAPPPMPPPIASPLGMPSPGVLGPAPPTSSSTLEALSRASTAPASTGANEYEYRSLSTPTAATEDFHVHPGDYSGCNVIQLSF